MKVDFITFDPEKAKYLPKTVPEIERWSISMGGKRVRGKELADLKRRGLIGMPDE